MDILYGRFKARARAIISLFTSMLLFAFLFFLLTQSGDMAIHSLNIREHIESAWSPPLYPVKMVIPIRVSLILLQSIVRFLRYLIQAITGVEEIREVITLMEIRREEWTSQS